MAKPLSSDKPKPRLVVYITHKQHADIQKACDRVGLKNPNHWARAKLKPQIEGISK